MSAYRKSKNAQNLFSESLSLLLRFFVLRVDAAPFAVLFQVDLALDKLPILARPIIDAAALAARYFYQLILRHARHYTPKARAAQLFHTP